MDLSLRGRPCLVASNNDGCAVARSDEVKALGIKMGDPLHEIRDKIEAHGIAVRSSNYTLYADMQRRILAALEELAPKWEVYSIDELCEDRHNSYCIYKSHRSEEMAGAARVFI